jgi:hypothetical protein
MYIENEVVLYMEINVVLVVLHREVSNLREEKIKTTIEVEIWCMLCIKKYDTYTENLCAA